MKKCSTCKEEKELSEFYIRRASKDGLTASCKSCQAIRDAKRHQDDPRVKARKRAYLRTHKGRQAAIDAKKRWTLRNPIKRKAHNILWRALTAGRLAKGKKCETCGATDCRIEAHHDDYSKPLEVKWLCRKCHYDLHEQLKKSA